MKRQSVGARWFDLLRQGDLSLAAVVLLIVSMMLVPLPTPLLDVLLATNLGVGVLLVLSALYARDGRALTALPSVLLVTTLYRLALNVSSTRLILLQADAGSIIRAFGDFVVRGDYLVGGVIFLILTLIQYVVIARGAERVAEVGARFSLDGMPGKQLAIDSDLRLGNLTPKAAATKRDTLERESQLYGAMDGAMKFVKGDAIAGIAISVINLVAGTAIGVVQRKMEVAASLQTYGLLTVGDGLVSQLPALLISTSAAVVVTRVASDQPGASLATDMGRQLLSSPRVLASAALALLVLGFLPGLPMWPFVLVATVAAGLAWRVPAEAPTDGTSSAHARVAISLGSQLHSVAADVHDARLEARVLQVVQQAFVERCGWPLPTHTVALDTTLADDGYTVVIDGAPVARGQTNDLAATLGDVLHAHGTRLFGLEVAQGLVETVARTHPTVVRHLTPSPLPLATLSLTLQRLLDEGVSLRHAELIFDALARTAAQTTDVTELAQAARRALQPQLSADLAPDGTLETFQLDPLLIDVVRDAMRDRNRDATDERVPMSSTTADDLVQAIARTTAQATRPVLLVPDELRRAFHWLLRAELPHVRVIGAADLVPSVTVRTQAWIGPQP